MNLGIAIYSIYSVVKPGKQFKAAEFQLCFNIK